MIVRVILEFVDGPFQGRKTALQAPGSLVIGRTEAAEYSVPGDPEMSSKHFRIDVDATSCGIVDLGSTNGTFVNDDRISEVELSHGDEVRAGQSRIQFSFELPKPSDTLSGSIGGTVSESPPPDATVEPPLEIPVPPPTPSETPDPNTVGPAVSSDEIETPPATSDFESDVPSTPEPQLPQPGHDTSSSPNEFEPPHALLEIESDFAKEKMLLLSEGQTMTFGSSELADVAIPQDVGLSEVHFSLEMKATGCVVRDRGSTTGLSIDGQSTTFQEVSTECRVTASETSVSIRVFGVPSPTNAPAERADAVLERPHARQEDSTRSIRVERLTGAVPSTSDRPFQAGMEDPDPRVVRAALHAAVWSRESWVLDYCRRAATRIEPQHWETFYIFAVIGTADDVDAISKIGQTSGLGSRRFDVLGAYGSPRTVDILLDAMASDRVHDSVKSGLAFSKITGIDIDSEDRVELLPEDGTEPDEFEREFLDTVFLPDLAKAKQYWSENRDRYLAATRWCRGHDVSHGSAECSEVIDLLSRWEACMRDHYHGLAVHTPTDVLKFQCRFSGEHHA